MIAWVELHRLNRVWRTWMDAHSEFVTPTTLDNLRYARIEANEAADLWMRERLPAHARNNERNHTIPGELAQVVMLTLTALDSVDEIYLRGTLPDNDWPIPDMDYICHCANLCVLRGAIDMSDWCLAAHDLLFNIATYPGVNVEQDLRQCWWSLAWKHASYHMAQYPQELQP